MFRKPIGPYDVGISKYDTEEIGDAEHRRRVPMTFYYPSEQRLKCPVIFYNHGLGGSEMESTVLCADLASSGFVVVSIGHPYGGAKVTYTDGTTFEVPGYTEAHRFLLDEVELLWYEDMMACLSLLRRMNNEDGEWKGRLDLANVGTMGVSYGGCCSVAAVVKSTELKYAVNLDGSIFVHPDYIYKDKPILVMCNPSNYKAYADLKHHECTNYKVHKMKLLHWEFSDGIYQSDRGLSDRAWADEVSMSRAREIIEFISTHS